MIDLESFKPVVAGTMVLNFKGQSLFATNPTLFLTPNAATVGQHVAVSDFPGAQTYWWLSTLVSLEASLSGGGGSGPIPVVVRSGGRKTLSKAAVAPATYNGMTFTPPKLSGYFVAKTKGRTQGERHPRAPTCWGSACRTQHRPTSRCPGNGCPADGLRVADLAGPGSGAGQAGDDRGERLPDIRPRSRSTRSRTPRAATAAPRPSRRGCPMSVTGTCSASAGSMPNVGRHGIGDVLPRRR